MDTQTRRVTVGFRDTEALRELCGERDRNLRWLESRLAIAVHARGNELHLRGDAERVTLAAEALSEVIASGLALDEDLLQRVVQRREGHPIDGGGRRAPASIGNGLGGVEARTEGQRRYLDAMARHDVVFGVGPAGTGKTYLAVATAVAALQRREVKRLVLTRPAVEAGERLGFLPGDLSAKVNPYLRPLLDALDELLDRDRVERMVERGQVEVAPLAFMRGRTLSNAFVILDEAQNCSVEQMAMFLTRIGPYSKAVVTGDLSQSDLPRGQPSGLNHAVELLADVEGIAVLRLTRADVVRHPLVARIAQAYARDSDRRRAEEGGRAPRRGGTR